MRPYLIPALWGFNGLLALVALALFVVELRRVERGSWSGWGSGHGHHAW